MADSGRTQFEILDRVDVGGMAEIFRAKNTATGEIMAIKRILPSLVDQTDFVKMFVDEAAVCLALHHPNIVRVDQIGMMDHSLFMSMEYVAGANLREVLNHASSHQYFIPIPDAVHIAVGILDGLAYAHGCHAPNGESLHLIHRDVSPPNVLLGYNGDIKLTDFGLVKSKAQISKTVPGLIKGKFSYLSPEAAYGESIDARSDIYAVGIILWEMLTSRPLFNDPVEMKILDLVRKSIIPPIRPIQPAVPEALEAIARKGLARDRDKRYQSAKEFADDLRQFLDNIGNPPSDIGKIVREAKPPKRETEEPRKETYDTASHHAKSELLPIEALQAAAEHVVGGDGGKSDLPETQKNHEQEIAPNIQPQETHANRVAHTAETASCRKKNAPAILIVAVLAVAAGIIALFLAFRVFAS